MLNVLMGKYAAKPFECHIIQTFRLWNWMFYFLLGVYFRTSGIKSKKTGGLWLLVLLLVCNYLHQVLLNPYMGTVLCEYYYSSPLVIWGVFLVFGKINSMRIEPNGKISHLIRILSSLFLPVYAIHMFVISYSKSFIGILYTHFDALAPIVVFVYVSMVSFIVSYGMMRIPFINRFFKI